MFLDTVILYIHYIKVFHVCLQYLRSVSAELLGIAPDCETTRSV